MLTHQSGTPLAVIYAATSSARYNHGFINEEVRADPVMPCSACDSKNLRTFGSEIAVHVEEGIGDLTKPHVLVFPKITICMDCGHMHGQLKENELTLLRHEKAMKQGR
jgi:hypothetical protein